MQQLVQPTVASRAKFLAAEFVQPTMGNTHVLGRMVVAVGLKLDAVETMQPKTS